MQKPQPSKTGDLGNSHSTDCILIDCSVSFLTFLYSCIFLDAQYVVNEAQQNCNNKISYQLESLSMVLNCHTFTHFYTHLYTHNIHSVTIII